MSEVRPDPDQLLAHVEAEETRARRGRLRIFFGSSAGVGKTYAMLEAAHGLHAAGTDIVIGYIEPHGRIETERLIEGLERLPPLRVAYRGLEQREFDLDGALKRRPAVVLVDELAHSNLTGGEPTPRHPKRWQDVEELLDAGIDVWTTVNVQHLESLNDLVTQITGAAQRETLPDRLFDEADEIELIDLPPDDLIARLRAGKVYVADKAAVAIERFFKKPNLMALRELALRRVADRVEAAAHAASPQTPRQRLAADRVLVAIGPDSQAEQLVRAGKRIAAALDAQWTVVYVETPELLRLSEAQRNRRIDVLRLAESLGAETVTLDGRSVSATLIEYAQTRNITRMIVGAPKVSGWRSLLRPSVPRELIKNATTFDVIVIAESSRASPDQRPAGAISAAAHSTAHWDRYGWALAITAVATGVAFAMFRHFELVNLVMVYLLGVTVAGLRLGRGPAAVTAIANVIAFDFCFVPPRFSIKVSDAEYVVTFIVMLIVALVIATLMASVRQQTRVAGARERRTALLYAMSRELAATRGIELMAHVAVRHVAEVFQCLAVVLLPSTDGKLKHPSETPADVSYRSADLAVAQWVADHNGHAACSARFISAAHGRTKHVRRSGCAARKSSSCLVARAESSA
jgi:two-component system sensor histidine kinase KdpD